MANIIGTTRSFGRTRSFIDERTGKEIDTWKKWEKAGFGQCETKNPVLAEKLKEARKKRVHRGDRVLDPRNLPT